jgi:hypothetical protein
MVKIRQNLKVAQDRKMSYANKIRTYKEFKVGEACVFKSKG